MLTRLLVWLCGVSPWLRRVLWRWWYNKLARQISAAEWTFMNYGFQAPATEGVVALKPEDEADRFCIQLYEKVTGLIDLAGKKVLEIGSGRGGGTSYLARYRNPESILGIDYSRDAVLFCEWRHANVNNADFDFGDAEDLPLPEGEFEVVINVESSHCYGNVERFFMEVRRVLRSGGHFLFADLRGIAEMQEIKRALEQFDQFEIVSVEDISKGVVAAMEADDERKSRLIQQLAPPAIRPLFREFAGLAGGEVFQGLKEGKFVYWSFAMQKRQQC